MAAAGHRDLPGQSDQGWYSRNISRAECGTLNWAKDMESSRRYLLQAEIEFWHEMLRLNKSRLPRTEEEEMRACLRRAVRSLNSPKLDLHRAAA